MGTAAAELLARTLARMPRDQHSLLVSPGCRQPGSFERILLERIGDAEWLERQIDLQAQRWPNVDRRVWATLWWYSVSQVFLTPTVASLFVTGRALSPRPADLELHLLPDGRIFTARSTAVLDVDDAGEVVDSVATAIRVGLMLAIPEVARVGAMRQRPLWAMATDSLANRLLWVGRGTGAVDRATALATTLVARIGSPMPAPRYVDIERRAPGSGTVRFVRRGSCCLIYLEPGEAKCMSCPRMLPVTRKALLRTAADVT